MCTSSAFDVRSMPAPTLGESLPYLVGGCFLVASLIYVGSFPSKGKKPVAKPKKAKKK